jgi:hypothetical protein
MRVSVYNSELQKKLNIRESRMASPDYDGIGSPYSVSLSDAKRRPIGTSKKESVVSKIWWKYSGSRTRISNMY